MTLKKKKTSGRRRLISLVFKNRDFFFFKYDFITDKNHKEIGPGKGPRTCKKMRVHNHNKRQENSNYAERLSSFRLAKIQKLEGTLC